MKMQTARLALPALLTAFAGAALVADSGPQQQPRTVLVFAAASLKTALDEVGAGCRTSTGIELTASYAASDSVSARASPVTKLAPASAPRLRA